MKEREIKGMTNPFNCDKCGKLADGGVRVSIVAFYGSRFDTCTMDQKMLDNVPVLCDDCFKRLMPDPVFREWMCSWATHYADKYPKPIKETPKPKSIQDAICSFLEKEGIEGFIKLVEEAKKHPDPIMDWLCEQVEKEETGGKG